MLRDITSRLSDGVAGINSAYQMFNGATNITQFTQADWFDAASGNVTSLREMFMGASRFNCPGVANWDTSKVTDMRNMFESATAFNQDISGWDTSKLQLTRNMFYLAPSFNQPIGKWNTPQLQNIENMFNGATSFNQPLNN